MAGFYIIWGRTSRDQEFSVRQDNNQPQKNDERKEGVEISQRRSNIPLFIGLGIFLLIAVVLGFLPKLIFENGCYRLGVNTPNEMGDAIGGMLAPFVGMLGVLLTFLAFWAQYDANNRQRREFQIGLNAQTKQTSITDETARRDRFANRYYMMLSIHRDNLNAIDVGRQKGRYNGRRALISMFNELKFIYWKTKTFQKDSKDSLSQNEIFQIAYLTFFFGFGKISTPMVLNLVGERLSSFTERFHKELKRVHDNKDFVVKTERGELEYDNDYDLGTGHLRRLSHYFRHLFQAVKYVNDQDAKLFNYEKKYSYVSNLRSQLSVHEQLLLYYNARSVLGKPWLDIESEESECLLEKYCMIKSIPLNAADFFEGPEVYFKNTKNKAGKSLFEWNEIKDRMASLV